MTDMQDTIVIYGSDKEDVISRSREYERNGYTIVRGIVTEIDADSDSTRYRIELDKGAASAPPPPPETFSRR